MFQDRIDAARQLALRLSAYAHQNPLVVAIPRGAVPMAKVIAQALHGEFDVVLVRKLRAPEQPELAIGSMDESGWTYLADFAQDYGADPEYMASEKALQMQAMRQRRARYTPVRQAVDPAGRIVIVVDDGLATGATMIAALHGLRAKGPQKLICAVAVAPADALEKIKPLVDSCVCLEDPPHFQAVGQFFQRFQQVEDEEVIEILRHPSH